MVLQNVKTKIPGKLQWNILSYSIANDGIVERALELPNPTDEQYGKYFLCIQSTVIYHDKKYIWKQIDYFHEANNLNLPRWHNIL